MPSSFQSLWDRVFNRPSPRKRKSSNPKRTAAQRAVQRKRLFEPLEERRVLAVTFVDPNPAPGNHFGETVVALSTGNVVITAPFDNAGGVRAGAVYLFNGTTGDLISTLRGSTDFDVIGNGGITPLSNGNFVIGSPSWHNGGQNPQLVGAVTWGSGTTGVSGVISASNSLIGSTAGDSVGSVGAVHALSNGNYVVRAPSWDDGLTADVGAVTWGNGATGISGAISAANSLIGTGTGNSVGSHGVKTLSNGNYVVISSAWGGGSGAVTFANGTTGVVGTVNGSNSLVGGGPHEIGSGGVFEVGGGNYVVLSPNWDSGATADVGAATWASGTAGIVGAVSASNSLVGSTAGDRIGTSVTVLTNGNYVLRSTDWDNGAGLNAGAATWGSASVGVSGVVSAANSLVGARTNDQVANQVVALTNGNYVVNSPSWNTATSSAVGAVTWANGATGGTGLVDVSNSLVGTTSQDSVGSGNGVVALANGNYVVASAGWDNGAATNAGAVTWANGATGLIGTVTAANSLVGTAINDLVGYGGVTALTNGNYVVNSTVWKNGSGVAVGAVTWRSGASSTSGTISAANSLVGSSLQDFVGDIGSVTALTNGNYVVSSPNWNNGAVIDVGAVTWGNGSTGSSGLIGPSNSFVGSSTNDRIGNNGVTPLTNGNYVITSTTWDNAGVVNAGAATWGNGATGSIGVLGPSNSLVGSQTNDQVGINGVVALANGNYIVSSANWDNGALSDAAAVSWSSGTSGISGAVVAPTVNHVKGGTASTSLQPITLDNTNGNFFARFTTEGTGIVRVGSQATGFDVAIPGTLSASFTSGNLIVTDIDGVGKDNDLTITRVNVAGTDYYEFAELNERFTAAPATTPASTLSNANKTLRVPVSAITGTLTINLLAGNDALHVNLTGGNVIPTGGLTFNGSAPTVSPGDRLEILGGNQGAVTYNYANTSDGSVVMANFGTISYTSVDTSLVNTGSTTDATFNLSSLGGTTQWNDDGTPGNGTSRISSPVMVTTDFTNPTGTVTINRGHTADSLIMTALPDVTSAITLGTSTAQLNVVSITGAVTLAANKSFTAFANGTIGLLNASSDLTLSGTGSVALTTTRDITMASGASITTAAGNIALDANQQVAITVGNFIGVDLANAAITSATGAVTVRGRGGDFAVGQQHGVRLTGGAVVGGSTTNSVLVQGTAGASPGNDNHGVWVTGTNSAVTGGGAVTVTGTAGGTGSSSFNYGVNVNAGGKIQATGSGIVTVTGTSTAASGNGNIGVNAFGTGTVIASGTGNVQVTGTGGGTGSSVDGWGVFIGTAANVTTAGAGTLGITGTGGAGTGGTNHGIVITQASTLVSAASGGINLLGTAGAGTTSFAVNLTDNAVVLTSANGPINITADSVKIENTFSVNAGTANVTFLQRTNGLAINLGAADSGTQLGLSDAELDRVTGGTVLIGNTNSGLITVSAPISHANHLSLTTGAGITVADALSLAANKNLTASAVGTIDLSTASSDVSTSGTGTIDLTTQRNLVARSGSSVITVNGALQLSANQQVTPTSGVFVGMEIISAEVRSTGSGGVTLAGRGGANVTNQLQHGIHVTGAGALVETAGGNLDVTGVGGAAISHNRGVMVSAGAVIRAGGAGSLTVTGDGGNRSGDTASNAGVYLTDAGTSLLTTGGPLLITGRGGGLSSANGQNAGVIVFTGSIVSAGGMGSTTIVGTGGGLTTSQQNNGVGVYGLVTSAGGNVQVTGAARGDLGYGVSVWDGTISAGLNGTVTVSGTTNAGSGSGGGGRGVLVSGGTITTSGGDLTVTATNVSAPTEAGGLGLSITSGGVVAAGGNGVTNVTATGAPGTLANNHAIYIINDNSRLGGGNGGLNVTATATDGASVPVSVLVRGTISTTGTGSINLSTNGLSVAPLPASGAGTITAGANTLTIQPTTAGIPISIGGADVFGTLALDDPELDQITAGTLILGNATSGPVTISAAITRPAATNTQINSGAAINFTAGSYNSAGGNVTLNPGTVISPATSGVDVTTGAGTLAFGAGDDLAVVINGLTADTQYQQLNVAGLVNVTGLDLASSGTYIPAGSEVFIIINNDGTDPVVGTFNGLPQGGVIAANFMGSGLPAAISYTAGTGNDVAIIVGGAPGTTTVEVIAGNLIITDAMGGNTNDNITISRVGSNIRIFDPLNSVQSLAGVTQIDVNTVEVPLASLTGNIQANTLAGNDSLTINYSGGNPLPAGGLLDQAGSGALDTLIVTGGTTASITHTITNASDGSITLTGALAGTISYTGLEPITDNLIAADRSFVFNAGAENITLTDAAGANQNLFSTLGRSLTFANPTASLTLDAASDNDTVTITSVDADGPFNASLTINGGTGNDIVNLNANLSLASGRNLDVNLQDDNASPGVDQIVTGINKTFALLGTGYATLAASQSITLQSGTWITSVDGNLTLSANQQATPTSGDFSGIEATTAMIASTGAGQILLQGRGGDNATSMFRSGILLSDTVVSNTANASVTLQGTGASGGTGTQLDGIAISGDLSDIRSHHGGLTLTGVGGLGVNGNDAGVTIQSGLVRTTGTGHLSITGTGGLNAGNGNDGIRISGSTTRLTTGGGNITLTGTGGGTGSSGSNNGVDVSGGAQVTAGSIGTVTVNGTGGNGTGTGNNNSGVQLLFAGTLISSTNGNVTVTGTTTNAGGAFSRGVELGGGASIQAGGSGNTLVVGNGGTGAGTTGGLRQGVWLSGAGTTITSGGGSVTVTGTAGGLGTNDSNIGVLVATGAMITAGGTGPVTVNGTGGGASGVTGRNHGVSVSTSNARITSSGGNVTVTGIGGGIGGSTENFGVYIPSGGSISAGGSGTVNITGTGGNTAGAAPSNDGIKLDGGTVTSGGGNVSLLGTGTSGSYGVNVDSVSDITTLTNGGNITISANSFNITLNATIRASAASTTTLQPLTAGTPINLGGADVLTGTQQLGLTDAELDLVSTGTLQVGSSNAGTITINSPITRSALTNLNAVSGAAINFNSGSLSSNGGNILLNAASSIVPATSGVDANSNTGTVIFGSGSDLALDISGLSADTQFQQLNVAGSVNLTGLDLVLNGTHTPVAGQTFMIVNNDGVDPIVGTFNGLAEGAVVTGNFLGGGLAVSVSYVGGTGNDVVLTVVAPPDTTSAAVSGGNLVITDIAGGDTNDAITITRIGTNIRISDPGNRIVALAGATQVDPFTVTVPFASITGSIQVNTLGGDDRLTLDFAIGNPIPAGGVAYAAGAGTGDTLALIGALTTTSSHTIASATDGSIVLAGDIAGTISYTGVESISDSLVTTSRDFTYPATADTIVLTDAAGTNQTLTGPGGHTITFLNPNASLAISAGGGNDIVTITSVDTNGPFNAALTINGGTGDDTVNLNADITFAPNRNLDLDLQNDDPTPGVDTINLGADADLILSGAGSATLRTSRNIALANNSRLLTVNGNVILEANQQPTPNTGNFRGISLDSAVVSATGTGTIILAGRGGDGAAGSQHGISIANSSDVSGGGTGLVSLSGRGGASPGNTNLGIEITGLNTSVTTTGAPLQITGQGDGTGIGTSHPGVVVASEALVSVGGTGALTISGTGGSTGGGIHHGVQINGATVTSGGGNIQIVGQVGANGASGGFDVILNSSPTTLLSTAGGGGNITVIGDDLAINATISTSAGNSVTLRPKNNGVAWNLGTMLSDAELDFVTTGTLNIGDSNTGPITISAAITRPAATTLNLASSGAINFTSGSLTSGGAAVTLNPGTSVSPGASGVDVNAGSGTLFFGTGDDLVLNITGPTVDTQYQQLNVVGTVNITGLDLVITGTMPAFADSFVIVNNDGTDPVVGTFNGLAEGAGVLVNGEMKKLTYVGGTGNDVALLVGTTIPPTINSITNRTINEDDGQQNVSLSGITAGVGENQALSVTATSSAPSIIPNPTVTYTSPNTTGSLAFTPVANANGAATITVTVRDAGLDATLNTADDGITTTNFTVTVTAINDAPTFVIGPDVTVGQNAGPQTVSPWATAVSSGPANESAQTVAFTVVSNSNSALFSVQPLISPTGVLTFTPATGASGSSTVTIFLQDDGGTALGGVDSTTQQTFTITVGSANTLRVTNFTVTSTGFIADFNRAINPTGLNLYDTQGGGLGPIDVILQRATVGSFPTRGSLVVDPTGTKVTFVTTAGRLPADDYTLTLRSGADGFVDTNGILLDGDSNGITGDNFVQTFTVTASPAVAISIPNFARGPQQNVNVPANATTGIPVTFSDGAGILSATFQLRFNPALLNITDATVSPTLTVPAFVSVTPVSPGLVEIQFIALNPLPAGATRFIDLQANVPSTAPYRSKEVLDIFNIALNDNIPAVDDDAVHVVAYFGDTTANGAYSAQDASRVSRLAVGLDSGLATFKLLDPVIIADISGNGAISATDTSRVLQVAVAIPIAEIPPLPSPAVSLVQGGPDPKLSIPNNLAARPGEDLQIPVQIDSIIDLTGNGVESADLVIFFDPQVIDVTGVSAGSLIADGGWMVASRIDPLAGRIFVSVAGSSSLEGFFEGELVKLSATVKADAPAGASAINLAASSRDLNRYTQLNEGYLTLIPAPTDAANDPVDGVLTITPLPGAASSTGATAQLVGDRLLVTGTSGDDKLFVAPISDSRVRVRAGNRLLGDFATPAAVAVDSLDGNDYVIVDPRLTLALIAAADMTKSAAVANDVIFAGDAAVLVESPAEHELPVPAMNQVLSPRDLALLDLLDQWGDVDTPAETVLKRRR